MHSLHRERRGGVGMDGWMDIVIIRKITLHRAPGEENGMDGYSCYQDTCTCVTPTSQSTHESAGGNGRIWGAHIFTFSLLLLMQQISKYQILDKCLTIQILHKTHSTRVLQNCRFLQIFRIAFLSHKLRWDAEAELATCHIWLFSNLLKFMLIA